MTTQLIYDGLDYTEAANCALAELPNWPVQDSGAHWHHEQFAGQMAVFHTSEVHFGFLAAEVLEQDVPRDKDGEMDLSDLFVCSNGKIYRAE